MYKRVNELLGTEFKSDKELNLNWYKISRFTYLSEDFIREFKDYINWSIISSYQILSEGFIREFEHYVNWTNISANQVLSEDFILDYRDNIDWDFVSAYQNISIDFIKKYINKLKISWLSSIKVFSWEDLINNSELFNWECICLRQPFIDPNSSSKLIKKNLLKSNKNFKLYQQTKNRGWFVGYIENNNPLFNNLVINPNKSHYLYNSNELPIINHCMNKVKIYWEDLENLNKIKIRNEKCLIRKVKGI